MSSFENFTQVLSYSLIFIGYILYTNWPRKEMSSSNSDSVYICKKQTICTDTSFTIKIENVCLLIIVTWKAKPIFSNIFEFITNPIYWESYGCYKATFLLGVSIVVNISLDTLCIQTKICYFYSKTSLMYTDWNHFNEVVPMSITKYILMVSVAIPIRHILMQKFKNYNTVKQISWVIVRLS